MCEVFKYIPCSWTRRRPTKYMDERGSLYQSYRIHYQCIRSDLTSKRSIVDYITFKLLKILKCFLIILCEIKNRTFFYSCETYQICISNTFPTSFYLSNNLFPLKSLTLDNCIHFCS